MDLVLQGPGPLQARLARALRQAIVSGRLAHGTRLPPTRELAAAVGVSRGTVVAAYEVLQAEGRVEACVGKGSFVRAPAVRPAAPRWLRQGAQSLRAARARGILARDTMEGPGEPQARYSVDPGTVPTWSVVPSGWTRRIARAAQRAKPVACGPLGLPVLREAIAAHLRFSRGLDCTADDILVVSGPGQALALTIRVLLDPGDPVAIEDPHHPGLRQMLQLEGLDVRGIPVDDHGMRVGLLAEQPARVVCVGPARQCPTGAVLSRQRREALLETVRRQDAWILERQCDGDVRRGEPPIAPLHAMDRCGRVVHYGAFPHLVPALRLGYLVMPRGLRDDFVAEAWASDVVQSALEQRALAGFIDDGGYARHVRRCAQALADRGQRLRQALAHPRFNGLRVAGGVGDSYLLGWLDGMEASTVQRLVALARQRGLAVHSLERHYLRRPVPAGLMLGFDGLAAPDIPVAMDRLGDCLEAVATGLRPRTAPSSSSAHWPRPGGCARPTRHTRPPAPAA